MEKCLKNISFSFDHIKATQCLNYLAIKQGGKIDKLKVLKLIYFADRYHLRKYGRLISNDIYFAMEYGPVASSTKDILSNSEFLGQAENDYSAQYINTDTRNIISSIKPFDEDVFSDSDLEALDFAWDRFGKYNNFNLAELTHLYPEWFKHQDALRIRSRIEMRLEDFLDDPDGEVENCFILDDEDRTLLKEQLQEMYFIEAVWR